IREKWEHLLGLSTTTVTEDYLAEKYPFLELEENILINSSFLPSQNLVNIIKGLQENQAVFFEDVPIAFFSSQNQDIDFETFDIIQYAYSDVLRIENTWDIFSKNGEALKRDFE